MFPSRPRERPGMAVGCGHGEQQVEKLGYAGGVRHGAEFADLARSATFL